MSSVYKGIQDLAIFDTISNTSRDSLGSARIRSSSPRAADFRLEFNSLQLRNPVASLEATCGLMGSSFRIASAITL